jgi:hypothetical protein
MGHRRHTTSAGNTLIVGKTHDTTSGYGELLAGLFAMRAVF